MQLVFLEVLQATSPRAEISLACCMEDMGLNFYKDGGWSMECDKCGLLLYDMVSTFI